MINNRQGGRRRGRGGTGSGGGPRQGGSQGAGNRQDNRQRGNAAQLLEKYKSMARDAQMAGDRVQTEYYLQYADHYYRVLNENRPRFEEQAPPRRSRDDFGYDEDDADDESMAADGNDDGSDDGNDRGGDRDERDERPYREERYARDDRPERNDRPERPERNDRPVRQSRDDRGDRQDRNAQDRNAQDRSDRPDRQPRDDRGAQDRNDRPARPERAERPLRESAAPREGNAVRDDNGERQPRELRNGDAPARRGRPRRDRFEAANEEGDERISLDVLPPAIAPLSPPEIASDEEAPVKAARRRTRRPREDDTEIAPAA